jgi:diguanylate cyclase
MPGTQDDRLRAIIQTQTEIAASDFDLRATMQLISERSQELTGASAAVIEIVDGDELVHEVTAGEATPYLGTRVKRDTGLSGHCVAEGRLLKSDDTSTDERVDAAACARISAASMVCVPLVLRREAVGVLTAYSDLVGNFDEDDIEVLELLTDLVAAHISHSSLLEMSVDEGSHDALTGMLNRRAYQERLAVETARAVRQGQTLSVCLFDLDGFKGVNERLGRPAGDEVLRGVARVFDEARVTDDTFRVGGDEFAVLMPHTEPIDAVPAARRLARQITDCCPHSGVGVSYGVAPAAGDPAAAHAAADMRLREAKNRLHGRSED